MSVFSMIRRSRQGKDEATPKRGKMSGKKAGKKAVTGAGAEQDQENQTPPAKYWHVPTHAASDALLGAPAGWVHDDAERIRESNRKRNTMMADRASRLLPLASSSSSSNMLSPLHIDVHAATMSSSSSSRSSLYTASRPASRSAGGGASASASASGSTGGMASKRVCSFNSLDAELHRARVAGAERRAAAAAAASASGLPSSSCSTPSVSAPRSLRAKDDDDSYFQEYDSSAASSDAFEMKVIHAARAAARTKTGRHAAAAAAQQPPPPPPLPQPSYTASSLPKSDSAASFLQVPSQLAYSRSASERTLVASASLPASPPKAVVWPHQRAQLASVAV